jgi:hypothetical protein
LDHSHCPRTKPPVDALDAARWRFALYPGAAEGGGSFRSAARSRRSGWDSAGSDSAADAARRARGKVRRYCAANRLNRLGTLTYREPGCHEPVALRRHVGRFFRGLRSEVGEAFPYVWAPEWHPGGHGLHVHFAVGRYIGQGVIRDTWGQGHVFIKLLGDLPVGSGTRSEARLAARYLAKYVGKDLGTGEAGGLHRYEVAQGFQPRRVTLDGATADEVLGWAETFMGAAPEYLWRSRNEDEWTGPPAVWASWT